jgi:uncharacterized membrane protein
MGAVEARMTAWRMILKTVRAGAPVRAALAAMPLLFSVVSIACPQASPASCPSSSATCPTPAPSYDTDVGPLIARYCSRCHSPDGGNPGHLLQGYDDVTSKSQMSDVLFQISSCRMPLEGEPQPTAAERDLILSWFACCGASPGGACPR